MTDYKNALPPGTVLDNRYRLEAVLGAGGFGIVYRATQTHLGTQHAIKEYLPQEIALREGSTVHALSSKSGEDYQEGLARFLSEARQLVPFAGHPNIVNCTDFFEANGTAYLVMQYEDGLALDELAAAREQNGEPFEEDEIVALMYPLLRGLQVVHKANVLHRDIKLGNIFIRRADEQPVLLDFGAAKQEFSIHSKSRSSPYTPGYAAMEQVEDEGQLGAWTDIHAVGAVFYRLMTGEVPVKVENRMSRLYRGQGDPVQEGLDKQQDEGRFSAALIETVRSCLAVEVKDRVPSVTELLLRLDSQSPTRAPKATEWETPSQQTPALETPDTPPPQDTPPEPQPEPARPKPASPEPQPLAKSDPASNVRAGYGRRIALAATVVAVLLVGTVTGTFTGVWDGLKPLSEEAERSQQEAVKLQRQVSELIQKLEASQRALDADLRDAEDSNSDNLPRLRRWSEAVEGSVLDGRLISGLEEKRAAAETLFQDQDYDSAATAFKQTLDGYSGVMKEFKAGEGLYSAEQGNEEAKAAWLQLKNDYDLADPQAVRDAEAAEQEARQAERSAELVAAVETWLAAREAWRQAQDDKRARVAEIDRQREAENRRAAAERKETAKRKAVTEGKAAILRKMNIDMVEIPAGRFRRRPAGEEVDVAAFRMGKHPVTFKQYDVFAEATGREKPNDEGWGRGKRPVINVNWHDAIAYIDWLNKQTGETFRLPSQDEWQYAAEIKPGTKYPWGNDIDCSMLHFGRGQGECSDEYGTAVVGSYPPNGYGLQDMYGNVKVWTRECVNYTPCGFPLVIGTSWADSSELLNATFRYVTPSSNKSFSIGFRLVQG